MLFNMSSQSARQATANILASLAHGEARQRQILDMLCSFLDEVTDAGEHSQEFLELLKILTEDESCKWKSYLAMRGVLPKIGTLIGKVSTLFVYMGTDYVPWPYIIIWCGSQESCTQC